MTWEPAIQAFDPIVREVRERNPEIAEKVRAFTFPGGTQPAFLAFDPESPAEAVTLFTARRIDSSIPTTISGALSSMARDAEIAVLSSDSHLSIAGVTAGTLELAHNTWTTEARQLAYVLLPEPTVAFVLLFTAALKDYPALKMAFRQTAESFRVTCAPSPQVGSARLGGGLYSHCELHEAEGVLATCQVARVNRVPFPPTGGTLYVTNQRWIFCPVRLLPWLRTHATLWPDDVLRVSRAGMPWHHGIWWAGSGDRLYWMVEARQSTFRYAVAKGPDDEQLRWLAKEEGWPIDDHAR